MSDYDLNSLGHREFEHLIQALAIKIISSGITPFGDGPDGGREATYEGKMNYPSDRDYWNGYLVIQCKFRIRASSSRTNTDGSWAYRQLEKELIKFTDPKRNLRCPEFYIFATNVTLSASYLTGAKDRLTGLFRKYSKLFDLKSFDIWSYDEICRFLDANKDIRSRYAHFISSGDLLTEVRTKLDGLQSSQEDANRTIQELEKERRLLQDRLDKIMSASMQFAASVSIINNYKPKEDNEIAVLTDKIYGYINDINDVLGDEHPDIILSRATVSSANMEYQSILEIIPQEFLKKLSQNVQNSLGSAIEAYRLRAGALFRLRRWIDAISCYKELIKLDPDANYARRSIGVAFLQVGLTKEALEDFEKENKRLGELLNDNPTVDNVLNFISNYGYLALANNNMGNIDAALSYSKKAISLLESISSDISKDDFHSHMAHILNNMSLMYLQNGQLSIALDHAKKSTYFFETIIENNKGTEFGNDQKLGHAISLSNCADSYLSLGNYKSALSHYYIAENIFEEIFDQDNIGGAIDELANMLTNRSNAYSDDESKSAMNDLNRALKIRQQLVNGGFSDREGYLAITLLNRGKLLSSLKKDSFGLRDLNKSITIFEKILKSNKKIKFLIFYTNALIERANICINLKKYDLSLKDLDNAIDIYLINKNSLMNSLLKHLLARAFFVRGNLNEILKLNHKDILNDFTTCIHILQELINNNTDDFKTYSLLGMSLLRRGDNKEKLSLKEAEEDYSLAISVCEDFIKNKGEMPEITMLLARVLYCRSNILKKLEKRTEATSDIFRSATLIGKFHEYSELKKEELLICNILVSYSSCLTDLGRPMNVILECQFFLDYLKRRKDKIDEIPFAQLFNNIGFAMSICGDPREATEIFDLAISIYRKHAKKSEDKEHYLAESINNRGNAKLNNGEFSSALEDYNSAIEIAQKLYSNDQSDDNKFRFARSLTSKAWLFSTCPDESFRNSGKALELAKKACEIMNWNDIDSVYSYAAACAENGDFITACTWQRKAIGMSSSEVQRDFLLMVLSHYEKNKPYRAQTVGK